jgi:hypothetical protein
VKKLTLNYLLKDIEIKPGLYLGNIDIYNLYSLLTGFNILRDSLVCDEIIFFTKFNDWIRIYYGNESKVKNWVQLIVFYESPYGAYETFFKLYKEWHKEEFGEDAW